MSDAYRCDKCGEFKEGDSFATTTSEMESRGYESGKTRFVSYEFCASCHNEYRAWVARPLDDGDDGD